MGLPELDPRAFNGRILRGLGSVEYGRKLGGCGGMEEARTQKARVPVVKVKTPSTFVTGGISGREGRLASG